jgi:hypothetical protein
MWRLPIGALYQLILYDDLANGRAPKWSVADDSGERTLDELMAAALTPSV